MKKFNLKSIVLGLMITTSYAAENRREIPPIEGSFKEVKQHLGICNITEENMVKNIHYLIKAIAFNAKDQVTNFLKGMDPKDRMDLAMKFTKFLEWKVGDLEKEKDLEKKEREVSKNKDLQYFMVNQILQIHENKQELKDYLTRFLNSRFAIDADKTELMSTFMQRFHEDEAVVKPLLMNLFNNSSLKAENRITLTEKFLHIFKEKYLWLNEKKCFDKGLEEFLCLVIKKLEWKNENCLLDFFKIVYSVAIETYKEKSKEKSPNSLVVDSMKWTIGQEHEALVTSIPEVMSGANRANVKSELDKIYSFLFKEGATL